MFARPNNNYIPFDITSLEDCTDLPAAIEQMRTVFARVFATHYAKSIRSPFSINVGDTPQTMLDGFSDLTTKLFPNGFKSLSREEMAKKLEAYFRTPGFDDEAAFLRAFSNLHTSHRSAEAYFNSMRGLLGLSVNDEKEVTDYLELLKKEDRELKKVDFVAITNRKGNICGFVLLHLFEQQGQLIAHVRQAAMMDQGKGFTSVLTRVIADKYPNATYEANQRASNFVGMKHGLIQDKLVEKTAPVLGYSDKYFGLKGKQPIANSVIAHYKKRKLSDELIGFKKHGTHWEAESCPNRFFSKVRFVRETFTDDQRGTYEKRLYIK